MSNRRKHAGVFQRPGRDGWYIGYYDQHGVWRQRKTQAPTAAEAAKIRSAILAHLEKAKILGFSPERETLFETFAAAYLEHQAHYLQPETYVRTESIVRRLLIPRFGARTIGEIRRPDIQSFIHDRLATGLQPASIRREMAVLKHLLSLAVQQEILQSNPAQGIALPKQRPASTRFLTPAEVQQVLETSPAWLKPIILFTLATGARRASVTQLRWRDVDLHHSPPRVVFAKTKANRRHTIILNATGRAALESVWNDQCRPDDRVFPVANPMVITRAFHSAATKAHMTGVRFHDLRHTTASWLAMQGVSLREIAELLDHSTIQMTMRYAHLAPDFMENTVARLDAALTARALPAGETTQPEEE